MHADVNVFKPPGQHSRPAQAYKDMLIPQSTHTLQSTKRSLPLSSRLKPRSSTTVRYQLANALTSRLQPLAYAWRGLPPDRQAQLAEECLGRAEGAHPEQDDTGRTTIVEPTRKVISGAGAAVTPVSREYAIRPTTKR